MPAFLYTFSFTAPRSDAAMPHLAGELKQAFDATCVDVTPLRAEVTSTLNPDDSETIMQNLLARHGEMRLSLVSRL